MDNTKNQTKNLSNWEFLCRKAAAMAFMDIYLKAFSDFRKDHGIGSEAKRLIQAIKI